jgi:hypothetical protein
MNKKLILIFIICFYQAKFSLQFIASKLRMVPKDVVVVIPFADSNDIQIDEKSNHIKLRVKNKVTSKPHLMSRKPCQKKSSGSNILKREICFLYKDLKDTSKATITKSSVQNVNAKMRGANFFEFIYG